MELHFNCSLFTLKPIQFVEQAGHFFKSMNSHEKNNTRTRSEETASIRSVKLAFFFASRSIFKKICSRCFEAQGSNLLISQPV
jgi:hypothetical protein